MVPRRLQYIYRSCAGSSMTSVLTSSIAACLLIYGTVTNAHASLEWSTCPRVRLASSSSTILHRRGCLGSWERAGEDRFKLTQKEFPLWCCCCGACDDNAGLFLWGSGAQWAISHTPHHTPFLLKFSSPKWEVLGGLGSSIYHTEGVSASCVLPTLAPTLAPSPVPTRATLTPTATPTAEPTSAPTLDPTPTPTHQPTVSPTRPYAVCSFLRITVANNTNTGTSPSTSRTILHRQLGLYQLEQTTGHLGSPVYKQVQSASNQQADPTCTRGIRLAEGADSVCCAASCEGRCGAHDSEGMCSPSAIVRSGQSCSLHNAPCILERSSSGSSRRKELYKLFSQHGFDGLSWEWAIGATVGAKPVVLVAQHRQHRGGSVSSSSSSVGRSSAVGSDGYGVGSGGSMGVKRLSDSFPQLISTDSWCAFGKNADSCTYVSAGLQVRCVDAPAPAMPTAAVSRSKVQAVQAHYSDKASGDSDSAKHYTHAAFERSGHWRSESTATAHDPLVDTAPAHGPDTSSTSFSHLFQRWSFSLDSSRLSRCAETAAPILVVLAIAAIANAMATAVLGYGAGPGLDVPEAGKSVFEMETR
jgi:hypothetical protein